VKKATAPLYFACLALAFGTLACGAKHELYEDKDWTQEHGSEGKAWREVEALFSAEESDADRYNYVLRGVRHDLTMSANAKPDARCTCMDVVVGKPTDRKRFRWAGEVPLIGREQLVVAVRTEQSKCPVGTPETRRPSIRAVDVSAEHVVVVIEELPFDRPQALGAIVQRPKPGGSLFLRARKYRKLVLPYGYTGATNATCKLYTRSKSRLRPRSGR